MPRGYTLVLERVGTNLGPLERADGDRQLPRRDESRRLDHHRPVVRVHRDRRRLVRRCLPGGDARQVQGDADPPRAPRRRAAGPIPGSRAGTTTRTARRSAWPAADFVNNDIYEFAYTAKDPTVNGLGLRRGARLERLAALRDGATTTAIANPLAGDIQRIYTEIVVAAGAPAQRLPPPRFQRGRERQEGVRRPHAVDRGRQRPQHELPLLADRAAPSATGRTTCTSRAGSRSPTS